MGKISVNVPNSLHRRLDEIARREGISTDQFVATAIAEKMSALMTEEYLEERARKGSREKYEAALSEVPDVEPDEHDKME
jgi:metal-responsive CopG/Arc/MetJ family transcriptional regulator